jgi:hypothetical protein
MYLLSPPSSSTAAALPSSPLELYTIHTGSTLNNSVPLDQYSANYLLDTSHSSKKTSAIIPTSIISSSLLSSYKNTEERSHQVIIQKKQVSFLSSTIPAVYDVNNEDSADSEDSSNDSSHGSTNEKYGKHRIISKPNTKIPDSEDSEDDSSCGNYGNAFNWLIKPERSLLTNSSKKEEEMEEVDCDDDASMDADVDGTHDYLFLNSESDDDENDNEERDKNCKLNRRREQKARSKRIANWNNKRNVDIVKTSYCRNSQKVEMVATKKYAGYLIREDANCMRFPDGSHYRLR